MVEKKRRRYRVTASMTISVSTVVEATSAQEAKDLVKDRGPQSLCHQCAGGEYQDEEWVTSGELDGTPRGLVAKREEP